MTSTQTTISVLAALLLGGIAGLTIWYRDLSTPPASLQDNPADPFYPTGRYPQPNYYPAAILYFRPGNPIDSDHVIVGPLMAPGHLLVLHDHERHVTCYMSEQKSISCLPDSQLTVPPDSPEYK
jgi:hypothetical protein